ncbi:hypothetical protein CU098_007708 [Rhizopus stolonifer]|uniref:Uncharacterized protein n=1 Tax=Rhizopus stolonifer TaxID=4846 RepID=A0A367JP27_RHIST|nr:hypothetical protein CU098_007708 [Rhizopus stolonifer]
MGAVRRYPYPKEVWAPAGGWWTRPSNWKSNTAVAAIGMAVTLGSLPTTQALDSLYVGN